MDNSEKYDYEQSGKQLVERLREIKKEIKRLKREQKWINNLLVNKDSEMQKAGPRSVNDGVTRKTSSKIAEIAKQVLLKHPNDWFGSAHLADKAVEMGLWDDHPATYQSVMSQTLKRLIGRTDWLFTKSGSGRSMLYKLDFDSEAVKEKHREIMRKEENE